ncbi:MAG: ECF-type sigma factor [Planctomycetota bacterium]
MANETSRDRRDLDALADELYGSLRDLARAALRRAPGGVLEPTELVHTAWLRLNDGYGEMHRLDFLALCATVMRRIAVDEARRQAVRSGGERVTLAGIEGVASPADVDLLDLDRALDELRETDSRWARIVELRFFGGLTGEEVADALGVSRKTVVRDWALARAWLKNRLDARVERGPQ